MKRSLAFVIPALVAGGFAFTASAQQKPATARATATPAPVVVYKSPT